MFNRLCGQGALEKVVLGATKSSRLVPEEALKRLTRLNDVHWKEMIDAKAQVFEFDGGHISALEFLKAILNRFGDTIALQIQDELVNKRMIIPETGAGKELRYTLEQVLEFQKHIAKLSGNAKEGDICAEADLLEARKKIEMLSKQLQQLKVPFSRRFLTFFNLQVSTRISQKCSRSVSDSASVIYMGAAAIRYLVPPHDSCLRGVCTIPSASIITSTIFCLLIADGLNVENVEHRCRSFRK